MERSTGLGQVTAAGQLQKSHPRTGVQPLPEGSPGRAKAGDVGIEDSKELTFFIIGDHGGVLAPGPQNAVSTAMERAAEQPAFVYSVGDVVYFYGEEEKYQLAKGAEPGKEIADGVTFEYGDAKEYGFLRLTVSGGNLSGEYTGVHPGTMPDGSDATVREGKDCF